MSLLNRVLLIALLFFLTTLYSSLEIYNKNQIIEQLVSEKKSINIEITGKNLQINYSDPSQKDFIEKLRKFEHLDLVIELSKTYGFDWKIIATQMYFESKFVSDALSYKSAKGLMQLMTFNVGRDADVYDTTHNIIIGISYFDFLYQKFYEIEDEEERIKFTLASYNSGITRVRRFQKKWGSYKNIEKYLPPETRNYVNNIIDTYSKILD